jgi:probable rRNA maturation factor
MNIDVINETPVFSQPVAEYFAQRSNDPASETTIEQQLCQELTDYISFCLHFLQLPENLEISLFLVGRDRMQELNYDFRRVKHPTDVISFPVDGEELAPAILQSKDLTKLSRTEPLQMGDLFICMDYIVETGAENTGDLQKEVWLLIAHGILHLLGLDHEMPKQHIQMFKVQESIRKAWEAR